MFVVSYQVPTLDVPIGYQLMEDATLVQARSSEAAILSTNPTLTYSAWAAGLSNQLSSDEFRLFLDQSELNWWYENLTFNFPKGTILYLTSKAGSNIAQIVFEPLLFDQIQP